MINHVNCRIVWIIEFLNANRTVGSSQQYICLSVSNIYNQIFIPLNGAILDFCFSGVLLRVGGVEVITPKVFAFSPLLGNSLKYTMDQMHCFSRENIGLLLPRWGFIIIWEYLGYVHSILSSLYHTRSRGVSFVAQGLLQYTVFRGFLCGFLYVDRASLIFCTSSWNTWQVGVWFVFRVGLWGCHLFCCLWLGR